MYEIFKRKVWRWDGMGWVPNGGARRTHVQMVETAQQARDICEPLNADRPEYGTVGYYNFVYHEFTRVEG